MAHRQQCGAFWGRRQVTSDASPAYDQQHASDKARQLAALRAKGMEAAKTGAGDHVCSWAQTSPGSGPLLVPFADDEMGQEGSRAGQAVSEAGGVIAQLVLPL